MEFFKKLFENDFMPHGHCYFWDPAIVWTNAISDSLIALAYLTIPFTLIYIIRTRKDVNFTPLIVLFAVFILSCGATHIMDVINIWYPMYRLDSSLRAITALASIGTALMLVVITPQILAIPNAEQHKKINEELKEQINHLQEKDQTIALLKKNEEMQDSLNKSDGRFKIMLDNIANLAWIANADGWITWYNQRWYEYTGTSFEEMQGWGWQSVHHPQELPSVMDKWKESIKNGEPFEMTFPLKGSDGVFRPFLTRVLSLKDDDGRVISWFGTNTDITARIKAEEELESNIKELQKINSDLDNFVYTASHDLKAPVLNIEGLIYALKGIRKSKVSEEEKLIMDMMNTSILRFKGTISDLTEITKIQRDVTQDIDQIGIMDTFEEVTDTLSDLIKEGQTIITYELQQDKVNFSRKNFRSIVYNLISNAIKYRDPAKNSIIQVSTIREGDFIILSISDNGLGIESAKKNDLFKMFKRFHDHVEGTGIGLYIVKRIIDNAEGKIEVESEIGKGSVFKIYFRVNLNY